MVSCKIADGKTISKVVAVTHKVNEVCGHELKAMHFETESERFASVCCELTKDANGRSQVDIPQGHNIIGIYGSFGKDGFKDPII